MNEKNMQAILMRYLMAEKHHDIAMPNSTMFFNWEADLVGITRAGLSHEIEIKISKADYRKDRLKVWKHDYLKKASAVGPGYCRPNYFWYATYEFEIEPPEYAGWLLVEKSKNWYHISAKKDAPRLHTNKTPAEKMIAAARIMSFRLMAEYCAVLERGR